LGHNEVHFRKTVSLQTERKTYITGNVAQAVHSLSSKPRDKISRSYPVMTLIEKQSHYLMTANPAAVFRLGLAKTFFLPRPLPSCPCFASISFLLGQQLALLSSDDFTLDVNLTLRFP